MPTFTLNVPIFTSTPTIAVEGLPVGIHRFQLIVEDESGNRSQPSFGIVTVLNRAPVVTSVSPAFGIWGDRVVITGANFDAEPLKNRVSFNGVAAQVELQAGPFRLVSLMTREAADELDLQPGMVAVASVKSTSVVIELPSRQ